METEKMTAHRALAELKLIDSKIEKQVEELSAVALVQKSKKIGNYLSVEDFSSKAQSKYDSITALIARKTRIKSALVKSNSNTKIKIGDKEMTVADAITSKETIGLKKSLVEKLKAEQRSAIAELNRVNEAVNKNAQILLQNALGTDQSKAETSVVDAIQKPYLEANLFSLVDPLKAEEKISSLETEIENFEANVDAVLSESNAITFIEF